MKKTDVFTRLDNAIGNYMHGIYSAEEIMEVVHKANEYLVEHPHPHDVK